MHGRAKRSRAARRSEVVNNSAGGENIVGGRPASARSRSFGRNPGRVTKRLPGEAEALATTSNRTRPQEGYYISAMDGRAKRRQEWRAPMNTPEQQPGGWLEQRGFGGLDWASQHHSVVVVDSHGKVLEDFESEHSALGWKKFRERIQSYGSIPFAIETSQGAAVEQLLEAGMQVYPLNPKSAQSYRQRKAPSGVKDDRLDAWSFADACRVDGQGWKALRPEDPLIKELRLLCRDEVALIEQRTAFINQLRHALAEYYPTALEAFEDWGALSAWMFVQRFHTPQALKEAGKRHWEKFLFIHDPSRTESGPLRLELFAHATDLCGSVPMANAKSRLALSHPLCTRKTARYLPPAYRGTFRASSRP